MQCTPACLRRRRRGGRGGLSRTWRPRAQALREGRLRGAALAPDERMRRPGLGTLVLDEADLMLAMPGYAADLAALAPLVRPPRARMHPALPCKGPAAQLAAAHLAVLAPLAPRAPLNCRDIGNFGPPLRSGHEVGAGGGAALDANERCQATARPGAGGASAGAAAGRAGRTRAQVPRGCQCLLMSATTNADVERLQQLVLHNPVQLDLLAPEGGGAAGRSEGVGPGPGSAAEIEHFSVHCDPCAPLSREDCKCGDRGCGRVQSVAAGPCARRRGWVGRSLRRAGRCLRCAACAAAELGC